jgi:hypothetical protein
VKAECETFHAEHLAGEPDPNGHLASCAECQAALGDLDELRAVLGDADIWTQLPEDLEDSVMSMILAEAPAKPSRPTPITFPDERDGDFRLTAPPESATKELDRGPVTDLAVVRRARRQPRRWLAAAAALVLVAGVFGWLAARSTQDSGPKYEREFALAPTELAPGASADVRTTDETSGVRIVLDTKGLPANEPGTFYQGWVKGPKGLVPIGTFRGGDGEVTLWSGVPLEEYDTLTVTLEHEDDTQTSSGQRVLAAPIPRS